MLSGAVIALVQASSTPTGHHQLWGSDADPRMLGIRCLDVLGFTCFGFALVGLPWFSDDVAAILGPYRTTRHRGSAGKPCIVICHGR
jgi:hypothetical protein